jgi:hypothetical protein
MVGQAGELPSELANVAVEDVSSDSDEEEDSSATLAQVGFVTACIPCRCLLPF